MSASASFSTLAPPSLAPAHRTRAQQRCCACRRGTGSSPERWRAPCTQVGSGVPRPLLPIEANQPRAWPSSSSRWVGRRGPLSHPWERRVCRGNGEKKTGFSGLPPSERANPYRPEFRQDYPLNLSISISGGKETNRDSLSNGERKGTSPVCKSPAFGWRIVVWSSVSWCRAGPSILE